MIPCVRMPLLMSVGISSLTSKLRTVVNRIPMLFPPIRNTLFWSILCLGARGEGIRQRLVSSCVRTCSCRVGEAWRRSRCSTRGGPRLRVTSHPGLPPRTSNKESSPKFAATRCCKRCMSIRMGEYAALHRVVKQVVMRSLIRRLIPLHKVADSCIRPTRGAGTRSGWGAVESAAPATRILGYARLGLCALSTYLGRGRASRDMSSSAGNGHANGEAHSSYRLCPALKYDSPGGPPEDRVICLQLEPTIPRAWCFICSDCAHRLLEGKRRRDAGSLA
jgi:hypothetical protein